MRNRVQLRIGLSALQVGNAAIRRPELFGQFNLCQTKLMPCPVQGSSKKIANIVHTFTLSYENQKAFYTEKIMKNPDWTMVDIFADEGITGTSTCRRKQFLRMIRQCRQGKIDMILAKSVSRLPETHWTPSATPVNCVVSASP